MVNLLKFITVLIAFIFMCIVIEADRVDRLILANRLEICWDRWDRRSCKIFPNCVKFWGNNANSLGNYRVTYALNE